MAGKRIYELTEKSSLAAGDFIPVDSSGQQDAQKVNASKITLPLANISQSTDEYSSATAYKVGDMVIHDNVLYVCNTACAAAPWSTNQGYFTATTIAAELNALNTSLAKKLIAEATDHAWIYYGCGKLRMLQFHGVTGQRAVNISVPAADRPDYLVSSMLYYHSYDSGGTNNHYYPAFGKVETTGNVAGYVITGNTSVADFDVCGGDLYGEIVWLVN